MKLLDCHAQVVKLSDAVQPLPRQTTAFVHGVPHSFIKVGEEKAKPTEGQLRFEDGAYFIGKVRSSRYERQSFDHVSDYDWRAFALHKLPSSRGCFLCIRHASAAGLDKLIGWPRLYAESEASLRRAHFGSAQIEDSIAAPCKSKKAAPCITLSLRDP